MGQLGLTRAQARRLLPAWWSEGLERTEDGAAELALHLSRRLSLDLASLVQGKVTPKGAVARIAFKHRSDVETGSLTAASFVAASVASAVLAACSIPYRPLPRGAHGPSMSALGSNSEPFGFSALLELCWRHGIPVIPLPHLPVGMRKMDGAALMVGNRPAIILAKKKSSRAWLSFILAHEMAHVALGHIGPCSSIVDISLQETSTYAAESSADTQELAADAWALDRMGGEAVSAAIRTWGPQLDALELAVEARQASLDTRVEAGHFVLRYAFAHKRWSDASVALRFLSEDASPEPELIRQLQSHLEFDRIAPDMRDLLAQITGWDGASV